MAHFAGLDVSIEVTVVCLVDYQGTLLRQRSVATQRVAIGGALAPFAATLRRAEHQAGALSPWLHPGLLALGVPVACLRQYLRLHNLVVRLVARDELCRRYRKGVVAVARKLAVVMHAMPRDGTFYADRPHPDDAAPTAKDRKHLVAYASGFEIS